LSAAWSLLLIQLVAVSGYAPAAHRCIACISAPRARIIAIFPGDDPFKYVRKAAKLRAAEDLAEEDEEYSEEFKVAYGNAVADIKVREIKAEIFGEPEEEPVEAASESSETDDCAEPTSTRSARDDIIKGILAAGGVSVDTEAQTEVFETLPDGFKSAVSSGSITNVRLALALMEDAEVEDCERRCMEVGFWEPVQ